MILLTDMISRFSKYNIKSSFSVGRPRVFKKLINTDTSNMINNNLKKMTPTKLVVKIIN